MLHPLKKEKAERAESREPPREWVPFPVGEFAECSHGYYFIFKRCNRETRKFHWFAAYERGHFGKVASYQPFTLDGLSSREEARLICERHAGAVEPHQKRGG